MSLVHNLRRSGALMEKVIAHVPVIRSATHVRSRLIQSSRRLGLTTASFSPARRDRAVVSSAYHLLCAAKAREAPPHAE
jgi:hypothetical protein